MEKRKVDVAVIGAGTAGLNAHREARRAGRSVLLIEEGPYGTTCARVGCMPSKLLITPANLAHELSRYELFGLSSCGGIHIDGPAVMQHVRKQRDAFVKGMIELTESIPPEQRLKGHARFTGPHNLIVDDTEIEAGAVVIATGSKPFVPPPFNKIKDEILTSDNIFELPSLPKSLAVIGAGIIGLELGQAMHRLGVETTIFSYNDMIGIPTDPVIQQSIKRILGNELNFKLSARITEAFVDNKEIHIRWRGSNGNEYEQVFEQVLVAAGRYPNIENLGLERTGLPLNEKGLPPFDKQTTQCGRLPIFMAGDVDDYLPVLHEAAAEGIIAGTNAAHYPDVKPHPRHTPLLIIFTEPQIAIAGKTYAELEKGTFETGQADFDDQARAVILGQNQGCMRIYASLNDCRIVGAEMFVPGAEHMGHLAAGVIQQEMTVQQTLEMPFYHPVLEEGFRSALRDLARRLEIMGKCRRQDLAITPGS